MGRRHLCNHLCNHLCIATSVATSVTTFRWDGTTAYGYRWPASGRAGDRASGDRADRYRLSARNSGLFFVQVSHGDSEPKFNVARYHSGLFFAQATHEALRMMLRLKRRMETEGVWDQTAYNEEQWYVALPGMQVRRDHCLLMISASFYIRRRALFCSRTASQLA